MTLGPRPKNNPRFAIPLAGFLKEKYAQIKKNYHFTVGGLLS